MTENIKAVLFWVILLMSDTIGQLLLKMGAVQAASSSWTPNYLLLSGYGFYIISFIVWMQILKNVRLFIALGASSLVYITVAFSSFFFMEEVITFQIIFGTVFIALGVFLLGLGRSADVDDLQ